jgi:hypothetical protein
MTVALGHQRHGPSGKSGTDGKSAQGDERDENAAHGVVSGWSMGSLYRIGRLNRNDGKIKSR